MTRFIGLSFGVVSDRLCVIAASNRQSVCSMRGLTTGEALSFLWTLKGLSASGEKTAFVCFEASIEFELLLRDLSRENKDLLFGLWRKREEAARETPLYEGPQSAAGDVLEIEVNDQKYRLSMLPGKVFRLAKPKRAALVLYDLRSYFDGCEDLRAAAAGYLKIEVPRVEKNLLPLWREGLARELIAAKTREAVTVARLGQGIEQTLKPLELSVRQWYGPSAIAARCLSKWKARKQMVKLGNYNSVPELLKAIDCAYFGGRVESIKLGRIEDIRTFDLNSAYAYATTLLSQFYKPLVYTKEFTNDCPFSCWLVSYELPEDVLLGVLPTRARYGGISFRRRGLGYFWFPEVDYMLRHYPDCCRVLRGYTAKDYQAVRFGPSIQAMYEYRQQLKARGDAGEKIIKLALANLYGKFCQNQGRAYYQCRAWAGWITSLVRRLLLEATEGREASVVCFAQDAIHLTGRDCAVPLGLGLGQWKRAQFQRGLYVAPGIYDLTSLDVDNEKSKQAIRGANLTLDFERLARALSDRQVAELSRCFFVGWALARERPLQYERSYLKEVSETLKLIPGNLKARNYSARFDWEKEYRDSKIISAHDGRVSSRYVPQENHLPALRLRLKDPGWS